MDDGRRRQWSRQRVRGLRLATQWLVVMLAANPLAAQVFEEFGKRHMPSDESGAWTGAFGDVDGDGDLDLALGSARFAGGPLRLWLNDGLGVFEEAAPGAVPITQDPARALAFADLDGDGDPDLVVGNEAGPSPDRVFENIGGGSFVERVGVLPVAAGVATRSVAIGDVDRDGRPDIVLGHWLTANRLLKQTAAFQFVDATPAAWTAYADATSASALVDFDLDGDLDVLEATFHFGPGTAMSRAWANDGSGRYSEVTASVLATGSGSWEGLALGDLDADGDKDLLLVGSGDDRLLENRSGVFGTAPHGSLPSPDVADRRAVFVDVDGDGRLDLVTPRERWFGRGDLSFQVRPERVLPGVEFAPVDVLAADFDSDGDQDLLRVRLEAGFHQPLFNEGLGGFRAGVTAAFPSGGLRPSIAVADLDGDAIEDVVSFDASRLSTFLNDGRGWFHDKSGAVVMRRPIVSSQGSALAVADVDGDGDLDVFVGLGGSLPAAFPYAHLFRNDGGGGLVQQVDGAVSALDAAIEVARFVDVDADGDPDLVVGGRDRGRTAAPLRLALNDGRGKFALVPMAMPQVAVEPTGLTSADLDLDGVIDLVVADRFNADRVFLGRGNGTFVDATATWLPGVGRTPTRALAVADFDGDGRQDLLLGLGLSGPGSQDRLFLGIAGGGFREVTSTHLPPSQQATSALLPVDLDRDGDIDVVVGSEWNGTTAQNLALINDGSGVFRDATASWLPPDADSESTLVSGDFDRDGDLDLISFGLASLQPVVRLLSDGRHHLHAPWLVRIGYPLRYEVRAPAGAATQVFLSPRAADLVVPGIGQLGIDLRRALALPAQSVGAGMDRVVVSVTVPPAAALIGMQLFGQAVVVGPGGARLTNTLLDVVGR